MKPMSSQELDRRITTFLTKKQEEFPELQLRPKEQEQPKVPTAVEVFTDLIAGIRWEFGQ